MGHPCCGDKWEKLRTISLQVGKLGISCLLNQLGFIKSGMGNKTDILSWHGSTVNDTGHGKFEANFLLLPLGFHVIFDKLMIKSQ